MSHARTGKIARAPFEVRKHVNEIIRDGFPAKRVIAYLDSVGIHGVTELNVSHWRDGGYQDWLAEQSRLDDMAAKREFALEIVRQNEGSKLQEATLHLAASQLYEALTDFDVADLKELLADKPENYADIVNSLAKLSKGALEVEKYKDLAAERVLDAAVRKKADEINKSDRSNADKIAAMRRELFRSVDELQKSGAVKIPKA